MVSRKDPGALLQAKHIFGKMTEEDKWSYLDLNNEVQGPFSQSQMLEWWEAGYLWPELKAKRTSETEYKALKLRPEFSAREKKDQPEEDEEDKISSTIWFYRDDAGQERGPFPFADMKAWILAGYLKTDLKVRKSSEEDTKFRALGSTDEFNQVLAEHASEVYRKQTPPVADYSRPAG